MPAKDYTRWTQNDDGTWRLRTHQEKQQDKEEKEAETETLPYSEWKVAELDDFFGDVEGYPTYENKAEKVAFAEAQ